MNNYATTGCQKSKTRSSAIAQRLRHAWCHWIFR